MTGAFAEGSNNRAELMAVITALEHERARDLVIVSDSQLTVKICTGKWAPKSNLDLWRRFNEVSDLRRRRGLRTEFVHVHGHQRERSKEWNPAHSPYNIQADRLARRAGEEAHGHMREVINVHPTDHGIVLDEPASEQLQLPGV